MMTEDSHFEMEPSADLFSFLTNSALTGALCIFGFIANTLTFVALYRRRRVANDGDVEKTLDLLLQGITVADIVLLWSLFVMPVLPSFGYIVPLLRHCTTVCHLVGLVTRPICSAALSSVAWTTAATVRYVRWMDGRKLQSPRTSSLKKFEVGCRAKWTIVMITVAVGNLLWYVLPSVVAPWIVVNSVAENGTKETESLEKNVWFRFVYVDVMSTALLVVPILMSTGTSFFGICKRQRQTSTFVDRICRRTIVLSFVLLVSYLPEVVLRFVDATTKASHGSWKSYLSTSAQLCIALNSSCTMIALLFSVKEFRECLGFDGVFNSRRRGGGRQMMIMEDENEEEITKTSRIYGCDDTTKVTLISQDESTQEGFRGRDEKMIQVEEEEEEKKHLRG